MATEAEILTSPGSSPSRATNFLRWAGIIFLFIAFVIAALVVAYQVAYGQRIVLGTRVLDMDLGALSKSEAENLISSRLETYSSKPITFRLDARDWQFTPKELGVQYNVDEILSAALSNGKEGNIVENLDSQLKTYQQGKILPLSFKVDEQKLKSVLARLAGILDKRPVNASLALEGTDLVIVPAQNGAALDQDAPPKLLDSRFASLSSQPVGLSMLTKEPAVKGPELETMRSDLQQLIDMPVNLRFTGQRWVWANVPVQQTETKTWTLTKNELIPMLHFDAQEGADGKPQVRLEIDKEKATAYAQQLAKEIDQNPVNARLQWSNGTVIPTSLSQEKRRLNVDALVQALNAAVSSREERNVEVPVTVEKAPVDISDIGRMGIRERLYEASTSFAGSIPERAYNIGLGARRLSGFVVPPGGTFSFYQAVGDVNGATGYQLAFAIIGGQTVVDPGGGICQVSTTVFQAAFWSGLSIVERYSHDYRMRRYEPPAGLDATVYPPDVDFRFRNNTANYILIQARTDSSNIYVDIYGTKPSWQVRTLDPVLTNIVKADPTEIRRESPALEKGRVVVAETPEDGVDVSLTRIVSQNGVELSRDTFFSHYNPERNVIIVGTG